MINPACTPNAGIGVILRLGRVAGAASLAGGEIPTYALHTDNSLRLPGRRR